MPSCAEQAGEPALGRLAHLQSVPEGQTAVALVFGVQALELGFGAGRLLQLLIDEPSLVAHGTQKFRWPVLCLPQS